MKSIELWKPVDGYDGIYEVSEFGEIRSLLKNKKLKPQVCKKGYHRIRLWKSGKGKTFLVHRIVAIAFLEDKHDKPQINHKNGVKKDNRVENLEWVSMLENIEHAKENGLIPETKKRNHGRAKLNKNMVLEIRKSYESGIFKQTELAKVYNVAPNTISRIVNRVIWDYAEVI